MIKLVLEDYFLLMDHYGLDWLLLYKDMVHQFFRSSMVSILSYDLKLNYYIPPC